MAVKNLKDLFEHELKDIYYAEHRLMEALEELASEAKDRGIKRAYTSHRRETQGQIRRLQKVFREFGEAPEPEKCPGIEGLLKEKQNFTKKERPSPEILEYYNLGAASKTERYEITAYESLIKIGTQLGMNKAVELLQQNLQEEQAALETLKSFAEQYDAVSLMEFEEAGDGKSSASGASGRASTARTSRNSASRGAARKASAKRPAGRKSGAARAA